MKCKICEKYFVSETNFSNLFVFEDICNDCKALYEISPKTEVFPIDHGLVEYLYLYEDIFVNYKQREYLHKNFSILFKTLIKEDPQKIILIIDDSIFLNLVEEKEYIFAFKQVFFMSLFRYNFEDL